jgi:hypothetical protein
MGHNPLNLRGEEAVNFTVALYMFSLELCLLNIGWQPYNPAPFHGAPPLLPNLNVPPNINAHGNHAPPPQGNGPAHGAEQNAAPEVNGQAGFNHANAGGPAPQGQDPNEPDPHDADVDEMLNVIMLD